MAKMPAAAPVAADDDTEDMSAAPASDTGSADDADEGQDEDDGDDVLVTITKGENGGYTVYDGDEPEHGSGDESEDESDDQGTDEGAEAAPEGKECDSMGAALAAAMHILKEHEESDSGSGSAASNFDAGFSGASAPAAPAAAMSQKY